MLEYSTTVIWYNQRIQRIEQRALRVLSGKVVKRRGGKRALKKRLGIIDIGKEMDKTKFGIGEDDEYRDSAMGIVFGMLGKDETGKIKIGMSNRKILRDGHPNKKLKDGRVFKPPQQSEF